MKNEKIITGIIPNQEKPVIFTLNKETFEISFFTDEAYSFEKGYTPITIQPNEYGFVIGKTHENHNIALYIGKHSLEFAGSNFINSAMFILGNSNVPDFDINILSFSGIEFIGGTINKVYDKDVYEKNYEKDKIILTKNNNKIISNIKTKKYDMQLTIDADASVNAGLKNAESLIKLSFQGNQDINTFFEHYNNIKSILSFMTFRENVGFDEICLLGNYPNISQSMIIANVYIKEDKELTSKHYFENINFEDIKDYLQNLFSIIYDTEDKKPSYSLNFLPKNDKDIMMMNNTKLKSVCTALECELAQITDIKTEEYEKIDELITFIKSNIKTFRQTDITLTQSTYDMIFSSMSHWSPTLAERLIQLYKKYENEMLILNDSNLYITDNEIREFVKYRNHTTHGFHRISDISISTTAFYMGGLVYCCFLSRIGLDRVKIKELCREKLLK